MSINIQSSQSLLDVLLIQESDNVYIIRLALNFSDVIVVRIFLL